MKFSGAVHLPPQPSSFKPTQVGFVSKSLPCQVPCLRKCQVSVKKMGRLHGRWKKQRDNYISSAFIFLVGGGAEGMFIRVWMNYILLIHMHIKNLLYMKPSWKASFSPYDLGCNASVAYDLSWSSQVVIPRILSNNRVPFGATFPSMKCILVEWNKEKSRQAHVVVKLSVERLPCSGVFFQTFSPSSTWMILIFRDFVQLRWREHGIYESKSTDWFVLIIQLWPPGHRVSHDPPIRGYLLLMIHDADQPWHQIY